MSEIVELPERTPRMSTIRHAWVKAHPCVLTTDVEERYAEFDRALAAHDAEVRAGAVAEEPEWEYGVRLEGAHPDGYIHRWPTLGEAHEHAALNRDYAPTYHRRVKAAPWVPVDQEET